MKTLRENELLSDILKKDLDDFWNDCLNITNSPTFGGNEKYFSISINKKNNKAIKNKNRVRTNSHGDISSNIYSNSSVISVVDNESEKRMKELIQKYNLDTYIEKEEKEVKSKKSSSMERTNFLYEKGKLKHKLHKVMKEKTEEQRIHDEINKCTWRPKINKLNPKMEEKLKTLIKDTKIYNRSLKFPNKTKEMYIKSKDKELYENAFNPTLNTNIDLENIFDYSKTIYNNPDAFDYISRIKKSRQEGLEKLKKLYPDLSKYTKHLWENRYPNTFKQLNEKSRILHKQHLHEELNSFIIDEKEP